MTSDNSTDGPLEFSRLDLPPPLREPRPRGPFADDAREVLVASLLALAVVFLYSANAAAPVPQTDLEHSAQQLDLRLQAQYEAGSQPLIQMIVWVLPVLFFLGVGAAVFLLHRLAHGRLHSAYVRRDLDSDGDSDGTSGGFSANGVGDRRLPYLETALLFLVAVTLVGALVGLAVEVTGSRWLLSVNWLVLAVLFWPLARGRSLYDLCRAMGWHRGRGLAVEVGCGLLAYLAALPVLAVGLGLTLVVTRYTDQVPHHPIIDWLSDAGTGDLVVVFLLAVVWAPLVEESLFRGGFYHYLRGRLGVFSSVLLASLVFAAIHPQGLAGIPFLSALASVLALTREWRDSIVASVTLHMVHNGLATLILIVLLP